MNLSFVRFIDDIACRTKNLANLVCRYLFKLSASLILSKVPITSYENVQISDLPITESVLKSLYFPSEDGSPACSEVALLKITLYLPI